MSSGNEAATGLELKDAGAGLPRIVIEGVNFAPARSSDDPPEHVLIMSVQNAKGELQAQAKVATFVDADTCALFADYFDKLQLGFITLQKQLFEAQEQVKGRKLILPDGKGWPGKPGRG